MKSVRGYIELCCDYKQSAIGLFNLPILQFCLNLMGQATSSPLVLTGEAMNEKKLLKQARAEHNTGLVTLILYLKRYLAMYFNDLEYAESLSKKLRRSSKLDLPLIPILSFFGFFMDALAAVEKAKICKRPSVSRRRCIKFARQRLKKMKEGALHCPENFQGKVLLIEAELATCSGDYDRALSKFKQSIVFAEHQGFIHEHAFTCEKMGRMLRDCCGKAADAEMYFVKARDLYRQYGASLLETRITGEIEKCCQHGVTGILKRGRERKFGLHCRAFGRYMPQLSKDDFAVMGY